MSENNSSKRQRKASAKVVAMNAMQPTVAAGSVKARSGLTDIDENISNEFSTENGGKNSAKRGCDWLLINGSWESPQDSEVASGHTECIK